MKPATVEILAGFLYADIHAEHREPDDDDPSPEASRARHERRELVEVFHQRARLMPKWAAKYHRAVRGLHKTLKLKGIN